jgi:lysophospholipase L1-like esterase
VLRNLALALVATLVGLSCAELSYRVYEAAFPPPAARPLDPELAALPELTTVTGLVSPNTRGRFMNVLWRVNGMGMRGPEVAPYPESRRLRIALLGDSIAAGVGVPEAEIYAAQLERLLGASGVEFEVLNLGLPGANAPALLEWAEQLTPRFHPRLLVYGYTLNDLFEPGEEDVHQEPLDFAALQQLAEGVQRFHSHLLPAVIARLLALGAIARPGPYTQLVLAGYADPDKQARLTLAFARLAALAEREDACAHVFVHTDLAVLRFGHPFADVYEQVAGAARLAGLSASTSFPAFRGRDSTYLRLSALDGHPNAEGHRILAGALYDALRALPPRCGLPPLPARGEE